MQSYGAVNITLKRSKTQLTKMVTLTVRVNEALQRNSQSRRILSYWPLAETPPEIVHVDGSHSQPMGYFSVEQWNDRIVPVKSWNGREP